MGYCRSCFKFVEGNLTHCKPCKIEKDEQWGEVIKYTRQLIRQDETVNAIFWDIIKENRPKADRKVWDDLTQTKARQQALSPSAEADKTHNAAALRA